MELKILAEDKNRLELQIKGESHTFCQVLTKELWNDEHVKVAAYNISHPLVGVPVFVIETDGKKKPQQALADAAKRLDKITSQAKSDFAKVIK